MPKPAHCVLTLYISDPESKDPLYKDSPRLVATQEEFEAFPTASCTLAQHFAAKCWYNLQARLTEPKEGSHE